MQAAARTAPRARGRQVGPARQGHGPAPEEGARPRRGRGASVQAPSPPGRARGPPRYYPTGPCQDSLPPRMSEAEGGKGGRAPEHSRLGAEPFPVRCWRIQRAADRGARTSESRFFWRPGRPGRPPKAARISGTRGSAPKKGPEGPVSAGFRGQKRGRCICQPVSKISANWSIRPGPWRRPSPPRRLLPESHFRLLTPEHPSARAARWEAAGRAQDGKSGRAARPVAAAVPVGPCRAVSSRGCSGRAVPCPGCGIRGAPSCG